MSTSGAPDGLCTQDAAKAKETNIIDKLLITPDFHL
jgi:hypothetical protein